MSRRHRSSRTKKLDIKTLKVNLIAVTDTSMEAEYRSQKVEEDIVSMILLGNKKGRPKKDDDVIAEAI